VVQETRRRLPLVREAQGNVRVEASRMMKLHEEKGTCETCRYHEAHDKHMYRSLCGRLTWNTKDDFGCIEYSRRIEEVK
jgi:hypothetical protein